MNVEFETLCRLTPYQIHRQLEDSEQRRAFLKELLKTAKDANLRLDHNSNEARDCLTLLCKMRYFHRFEYLWIGTTKAEIVHLLKRFGISELAQQYLGFTVRANH